MIVCAAFWYAKTSGPGNMLAERSDRNSGSCAYSIDWSADGTKLLTLSCDEDSARGKVVLHDLMNAVSSRSSDAMRFSEGLNVGELSDRLIYSARLAPDGRHVLVGTEQGKLTWNDLSSYETQELTSTKSLFSRTAISPDGQTVAAADSKGIHVFQLERPGRVDALSALPKGVTSQSLNFSNDGKRLLSANSDGSIAIWDVVGQSEVPAPIGRRGHALAAFCSCDGSTMISGGNDESVHVWQIPSGHEIWSGPTGVGRIRALAVTNDGRKAAWTGREHRVIIGNLESPNSQCEILTVAHSVTDLKFSPDGRLLAVAGLGAAVRIYDSNTGAEQSVIGGPKHTVTLPSY
jgi:WD40 repeat protein